MKSLATTDDSVHKRFKLLSADCGKSITDLLKEAIELLEIKYHEQSTDTTIIP